MHRIISGFLWLSLALTATATVAGEVAIPEAQDLRAEGAQLRHQRTPMLVMFYADDCPYCVRMEEEFLKPMLISGAYEEKVVMRRVRLDANFVLTGFDGKPTTGADLAAHYNVFVTPTLLFLDGRGNPLADKMVGLSTPDFFGGYLDAAIDTALMRLRGRGETTSAVAGRIDPSCNPMC